MNIRLPLWKGKRLLFLPNMGKADKKITKSRQKMKAATINRKKLPHKKRNKPLTPLEQGIKTGQLLTSSWRSQANPGKVFIGPYRIHHGLVGAILALAGLYYGDDCIAGLGTSVAIDDLDDVGNWLDFENYRYPSDRL